MIKKTCFQEKWIRRKSKELRIDPILIERVIYAFELLSLLIKHNIDFVFKGGTSLMLILPEFRRLSLDLDIVAKEEKRNLEIIFNEIIKKSIFKRWEEDKRFSREEFPKKHFKFYFDSPLRKTELYVLLDVLQIEQSFFSIIKMPIFHPIFEVEEEITVSVPSINSLAGDKLTAFAPNTIGIRYGKAKSMEIIKQLFDLGILFEHISNLKEIYRSYKNIARLESSFRDLKMPVEQYLDDSIETSFLICQLDFKGSTENDHTEELRNGIRRIKSHVFRGQYSLLKAKEDASKVACLASLIKRRQWGVDLDEIINNRSNINKIKDFSLSNNYRILDKLKTISPESHYLWLIAAGVIG